MTETYKAVENFDLGGSRVNMELIYAMTEVKKACAMTHLQLKVMEAEKAEAIIQACDQILEGDCEDLFVTQALQGGAGTSTNMNVNEAIVLVAAENGKKVHPLDDVNRDQSTNDVYPTALRIACVRLVRKLSEACAQLQESLQQKENEYKDIRKLGRTQLMDAMPITLGQEFGAYAQSIARDRWRIYKVEERLRQISLGGTAVGTGSSANRRYTYKVIEVLRELTGIGLARAEYPMDLTQNQDIFVEVSGLLKALAVNLMKLSSDLRLMNSGPAGGLGEIHLQKLQRGSTIMPGKVNPVIPEMVTQVSIRVMANDSAITICAANGNLELNPFLPLIADSLLESLQILTRAVHLMRERCIETLQADEVRCQEHLERSMTLINALVPVIGYDEAEKIYEKCEGNTAKIAIYLEESGQFQPGEIEKLINYQKESTYS